MKKYYTHTIKSYLDPYGYSYKAPIEEEFENYDDAVTAAKKTAAKLKEDVTIYTIDSVVKFPVDDYQVEKVV